MFIFLVPILIVFTCQAMWIWHAYDYQDFPRSRLIGAELLIVLSLILVIGAVVDAVPSVFFFIGIVAPTLGWFLMMYMENLVASRQIHREANREVRKWLDAIAQDPKHYVAHECLGNIYFERKDYRRALEHYGRAREIKDTPALIHKSKIAEKEYRIQKGEIWVCDECSFENPGAVVTCAHCGHIRRYLTAAKADIVRRREEIKRESVPVILGGLVVMLVFWLARSLPDLAGIFVAVAASLFVMFVIVWKFVTF